MGKNISKLLIAASSRAIKGAPADKAKYVRCLEIPVSRLNHYMAGETDPTSQDAISLCWYYEIAPADYLWAYYMDHGETSNVKNGVYGALFAMGVTLDARTRQAYEARTVGEHPDYKATMVYIPKIALLGEIAFDELKNKYAVDGALWAQKNERVKWKYRTLLNLDNREANMARGSITMLGELEPATLEVHAKKEAPMTVTHENKKPAGIIGDPDKYETELQTEIEKTKAKQSDALQKKAYQEAAEYDVEVVAYEWALERYGIFKKGKSLEADRFCVFCGTKVPRDADNCPGCKRYAPRVCDKCNSVITL